METELYSKTADILKKSSERRATLKTLIYASETQNIRQLFALVTQCNKYKTALEEVLSHCPADFIEEECIGGSTELAIVLLYEYLLGRKFGRTVSLRKVFQHYKEGIKSAVESVLHHHGAKSLQELVARNGGRVAPRLPRYMRINLIKSSVESAQDELVAEGWQYVGKLGNKDFVEKVGHLEVGQFGLDPVLPDLLVFPPGTDLHDHRMTKSGVMIQQDRASCVPAHVLRPTSGSVILDCCSAPGNKTSHLASLMGDEGRVIALDRDYKRMQTMSELIKTSGASCVELIHQDFLTVRPDSDDAADIDLILVDPSCSGSGMPGAQTGRDNHNLDDSRLQTLKRFQISILKHALRFPSVKRVVYSTCSVHQEENEEVVEEVMEQVKDRFRCTPVLPEWPGSRGLDGFPHAENFLRLSPESDLTQGFFVACFERRKEGWKEVVDGGDDLRQVADCSNEIGEVKNVAKKERKKLRKDKKAAKKNENVLKKDRNVKKMKKRHTEETKLEKDGSPSQQSVEDNDVLQNESSSNKRKRKLEHSCEKVEDNGNNKSDKGRQERTEFTVNSNDDSHCTLEVSGGERKKKKVKSKHNNDSQYTSEVRGGERKKKKLKRKHNNMD